LEANGQAIPNGVEYEEIRRIYGSNLPDLRGIMNGYVPKDIIAVWGSSEEIPANWSEAEEYRGVFLRGYGSITHTQNNGSTIGSTATTHSSGNIGAIQGDSIRNMTGAAYSLLNLLNNFGDTQSDYVNGVFYSSEAAYSNSNINNGTGGDWYFRLNYNASRVTPTANEIRPVNKAVRFIKHTPPAEKFRYIVKVKN